MKKKITALALVVAILAIAIIGGTLAYFTDTKTATNTFTVGNVKIKLDEKDPTTGERTETGAAYTSVTPGVAYAKDPTVTNIGNNDAWIRVNVTLSNAAAFKAAAAAHGVTDLATVFDGHDETKWTLAGIKDTSDDTTKNTLTYSYYYKTVLAQGASTGPLFTTVTVPASFTTAEMAAIGNFTITVTADAIQKESFDTAAAAFAAFDVAK